MRFFENFLKLFAVSIFLFPMLLCYVFWSGGHFPGSGTEPFFMISTNDENKISCKIEGKQLFVHGDSVNVSFFRLYFNFYHDLNRKFHIYYQNENGEKNDFVTYMFPLTYGIGAIIENTDVVIEETSDFIKIYYDKEPVNGFALEGDLHPFSKKILFEFRRNLYSLKKKGGVCAK